MDGEWASMDLANNCKAWEQATRNKTAVMDADPHFNPQLLRTMALRGRRLFSAIKRDGGDEATTGSFAWVVKQGIELLDSRDSRSCLPLEVDQTVQWWFKAALEEAGLRFASDLKPDSDFAKPLRNVFLLKNGRGCITKLHKRLEEWNRFGDMQEEMPRTFGNLNALLQQHNVAIPDARSAQEVNGMTLTEPMAEVPAAKRQKTGSVLLFVSRSGRTVSTCVSMLAPAPNRVMASIHVLCVILHRNSIR
jgi:hypothetical protein